jgi:uncharacterized protein
LQSRLPKEAAVINVSGERISLPITRAIVDKTRRKADEIAQILRGEKPPLKLSTKCRHSPWFNECVRAAEEANDVALIYKVHQKTLEGLRGAGIYTVADAAKMDIYALPKITHATEATLNRIKWQAQSLQQGTLKWIGKPDIPDSPLKIYFDIEGDPLLDVQYLFGFLVVGDPDHRFATHGRVHQDPGSEGYYLYFLAERPDQEEEMWRAFSSWVAELPKEYIVYHYATYEHTQLDLLGAHYGSSDALATFKSRLVDLAKVVQDTVIFPTYFYSIKNLAKSKFLNYKWRHAKAGGAQSIFWYEKWLEEGDRDVLQDIIDYNEDDVVATRCLHRWLQKEGT